MGELPSCMQTSQAGAAAGVARRGLPRAQPSKILFHAYGCTCGHASRRAAEGASATLPDRQRDDLQAAGMICRRRIARSLSVLPKKMCNVGKLPSHIVHHRLPILLVELLEFSSDARGLAPVPVIVECSLRWEPSVDSCRQFRANSAVRVRVVPAVSFAPSAEPAAAAGAFERHAAVLPRRPPHPEDVKNLVTIRARALHHLEVVFFDARPDHEEPTLALVELRQPLDLRPPSLLHLGVVFRRKALLNQIPATVDVLRECFIGKVTSKLCVGKRSVLHRALHG
mmetsp:Transcript_33851/g.92858  ORF Transcript_33851/g.92858 Transcript_33851/m.92858 type:complete len:283 (-) Transcript_33851:1374-2222(-)